MKKNLLKTKLNLFIFLFFVFSGIVNAANFNINSAVTYSATYAGADIVVQNGGTFTINSDAQINSITVNTGGTLIINSPFTLTVGVVANTATTQVVDFQNGSNVNVKSGATLIVYGLMNNSNNSAGIVFDGAVSVNGNVTGGQGSVISGSGTLNTTGSITTANNGQPGIIFGSTGDCSTGPCSGGNLCNFTGSISSNQTICSNSTPSVLTSSTSASSPTYQWQSSTTSGGGFTDISPNGTSATYTFSSTLSQTTYYRLKIKSTCTAVTSEIAITVTPAPAAPTGTAAQSFCSGSSPTVANLAATGTAIKWYTTSSGGSALATTTALVNGTHYFATQTVSGCESTSRFDVTATVNTTPVAPTGTAAQSFCSGASPTVVNLAATGTAVQWYTASSGGSALATTTALVNGTHYFATQTVSGCESTSRFDVTATVNTTPVAPTGTAAQSFCSGASPTVANLAATGTAVQWYAALSGGSPLATTTTLVNGTHYFATQTISGCESTSRFDVTATVNTTPAAPTGTAAQSFCSGASPTVANLAATGTAIKWYTASSGGSALATTTALVNGTHYFATQTISGCESTSRFDVTATVNTTPAAPTGTAAQSFCSGASPTVANLAATGTAIKWYTASSGGSALATTTALVNGTHYFATQTVSGCESTSRFDVTATVNTTSSAPTGTAAQSFCSGALPTVANLAATGTAVQWYAALSGGSPLATTTALVNGTHYFATQTVTGCESTSRFDVTATVNTTPASPMASATSQPTCALSTGTITVSSPIGLNYSIDGVDYSNSDGIFSGLAVGSYTVMARNGSCISPASAPISINAPITNTWNGAKWSKTNSAVPPTIDDIVVFNGNYSENVDIEGCSCQVNAGFTVTIPSGKTMTITNAVTNGGTLIFENNASLVQLDDAAVNTGSITYRRISAPMKNFDFTYWSSPVKDQILNVLSPNTFWDKYYSYANNKWVTENGNNKMNDAGKGFIIRVPKPNSTYPNGKDYWTGTTYSQPVEFTGVPYNGVISVPVLAGQNNLIGNPYPSAVDAETFMEDNASVIYGGLYFWTHNSAPTQTGTVYSYASSDYAVFTLLGSTGVAGIAAPVGQIASGQSFFVGSKIAGNFVFNNGMRISDPGSNSQFFKITKTKKTVKKEKNRVWLNLSNAGGAFKQLLVGYMDGATNGLDNLYDGVSFSGNSYVDFYSINNEKTLTIQGRALPFDKTDEVPLGYKATIDGAFEISIDKVDGALANQAVYIEDKVANVIYNLKNGPYSFTTLKGTFNDRFVLRYADKTTLGTDSFDTSGKSVIVSVKNHQIKINSFEETIAAVMVYDLKGSLIYENSKVSKNDFIAENLTASDQFLIVLIQLENGKWVTQEIIFQN
ncbi:hypothetical protein [Flavobacterium taihuense]|uniref:Ig-like domain-containing protein n=1 Tax=Flavobacterium taihuense TaxID=2857508 RepID=A0ABS6XWR4_9FLAO|nr:hypothetical protein [Flavobacterium taihuense]MBW4361110.1 hypothetical protein [Flavobacterium taihuense]